jgi:hypothetical protein
MTSSVASLVITIGLWALLALICCAGSGLNSGPHQITYRVDGTARSASVTYSNGTGGTEQKTVSVPWSKSFDTQSGEFLYISAQNNGEYGDVTVSITADGKIIKDATSSGEYVIATASEQCCPSR